MGERERTNYRVHMEGQFRKLKEIEREGHSPPSEYKDKTSQADKTTGARGTYILESTGGRQISTLKESDGAPTF